MEIIGTLRDFLVENRLVKNDQIVDDGQSLLESGIIDSLAIFELTGFIEKKYNIQIDADDLIRKTSIPLKQLNPIWIKNLSQKRSI